MHFDNVSVLREVCRLLCDRGGRGEGNPDYYKEKYIQYILEFHFLIRNSKIYILLSNIYLLKSNLCKQFALFPFYFENTL